MVEILELGYSEWSGLSFILDEEAETLEKLVQVTNASEESVVKGLEKLKAKGLITITYDDGKIRCVEPTKKGLDFYDSYC